MSDTQTPYLGLIKPLVNDPEGEDLWGDKLNRNFDLLDTFAQGQGALNEAPQDGPIYGRGTPETWYEVPGRAEFDNAVAAGEENAAAIAAWEAPTDGRVYSRKGSTASWVVATAAAVVSDTPPTGFPISTLWWNSLSGGLFLDYQDPNSRQWVMVNAPGMPEANIDGETYGRRNGAWVAMTTAMAAYLPLAGGTITGNMNVNGNIRVGATGAAGVVYLGNGDHYLYWDGTNYSLGGKGVIWSSDNLNPAAYLPLTGGTLSGGLVATNITVSGELRADSGVLRLNAATTAYLHWDGTNYNLGGKGQIWHTGNFNPASYAPVGGVSGNWIVGSSTHGTDGNIHMPWAGDWLSNVFARYAPVGGVGGDFTTGGSTRSNGILYSIGSKNSTTTSSVNVFINSTDGNFARVTSSADFKTALEPLEAPFADKVLDLQTVFYRPSEETIDRTDWSRYGFIAENCYEVDPRFSSCLEEATPTHHDINAIVAALLDVVRRQGERIAALEAARGA